MDRYFTNRMVFLLWAMLAFMGLSSGACAAGYDADTQDDHIASNENSEESGKVPLTPIVIRVTGYSAFEKTEDMTSEPKRLMALRASKLDAYRALAERIYGTSISGMSTVQDFVLKNDGFGTVVDSVIRGARVVSVSEKKGAGFETVLELLLPGNFQDCLNKTNSFRYGSNCLRPMSKSNAYGADSAMSSNSNAWRKKGSNSMDSIYYLQ
jgi:hypothetical protein